MEYHERIYILNLSEFKWLIIQLECDSSSSIRSLVPPTLSPVCTPTVESLDLHVGSRSGTCTWHQKTYVQALELLLPSPRYLILTGLHTFSMLSAVWFNFEIVPCNSNQMLMGFILAIQENKELEEEWNFTWKINMWEKKQEKFRCDKEILVY